jgi:sarcosine oxidase, subunit alpha
MSKRLPAQSGEWINREKPIKFSFENQEYTGFEGDTISSALWAAGEQVLGRSFKYHRPRGVLSLANHDVNILVTDGLDTNIRADIEPIREGIQLRAVNTSGGVKHDKKRFLDALSSLMPVGFYYKAFHSPRKLFPFWENLIRKSAGLGEVNFEHPRILKRKQHRHCDVLIIGAGAAGLSAAIEAANAGVNVTIIDENSQAGGSLSYDYAANTDAKTTLTQLLAEIKKYPNIQLLTSVYAAGYYADHFVPLVSVNGNINMRAKAVIVASGAFEQPLVFRNNDLPGVMLGTAAQRLLHRYSVKPFMHGMVFTANSQGYRVALDLLAAGVKVLAVVDLRTNPNEPLAADLLAQNIQIYAGYCVYEATPNSDKTGIQAAIICPFDEATNTPLAAQSLSINCDGIAMCAGWAPAAALLYQAGTAMRYDYTVNQFVPNTLPKGVFAAGKVNGVFTLEARMADGKRAANEALQILGKTVSIASVNSFIGNSPSHPYPIVSHHKAKNFIDFDEDIQLKDFINAAQEGFDNIELMKRFTTVGMGPSQGKHSNMNAIRILAKIRDLPVEQIGTTTARPFFHPTPLGHLAGHNFHPHRLTSLHDWHASHGAEFTDVGVWKRAAYYPQNGQRKEDAIQAEALAVRQSAGIIDASSFGKIEVHGKDAAEFLERFFTGNYATQKVGACRYLLALDESGVVIDDGIASRLADDLFYLSVGTSNAALVYREMQRCQQMWQLDIGLVNVTGAFGAINLAGPAVREILAQLTQIDLSAEAFPISQVREGAIAGVPARLIRVSFVSDLSFEMHIPMAQAPQVWNALLEAGKSYGLRPLGIEAQRLLRLEMGHFMPGVDSDGLSNPFEIGAEWALKMNKPFFIGQRSLQILAKRPLRKLLLPFTLEASFAGELPLECNLVIDGDDIEGRVTSISFSKYLDRFIGLAYVNPAKKALGSTFKIRTDNGSLLTATVVEAPFFQRQKEV